MKTLISFILKRETAKAILVNFKHISKDVWIPKSIMDDLELNKEPDKSSAYIPDWFLEKNEI